MLGVLSVTAFACGARRLWWRRLGFVAKRDSEQRRTTIEAQARSDGLRLLRIINDTQAHGEKGARADPTRAAHEAGLEVGSERYQDAMAYLIEQAALLGDEHTAFDVGDQHPHGYDRAPLGRPLGIGPGLCELRRIPLPRQSSE